MLPKGIGKRQNIAQIVDFKAGLMTQGVGDADDVAVCVGFAEGGKAVGVNDCLYYAAGVINIARLGAAGCDLFDELALSVPFLPPGVAGWLNDVCEMMQRIVEKRVFSPSGRVISVTSPASL